MNDNEMAIWQEKQSFLADLEVQKKMRLADIERVKEKEKTEMRLDLQAQQNYKQTLISEDSGGSLIVQLKQFGKELTGKLPIRVESIRGYCHMGDIQASVWLAIIRKENGEVATLFWDSNRMEDRCIRKTFERESIFFGFSEKKEAFVRRQILLTLMARGQVYEIPDKHGWYQEGNEWKYAFPEMITWREVAKWC